MSHGIHPLEARTFREASQLAVSSTGLWLRQGDGAQQDVVHALRVADQGELVEEVIVFRYDGLDTYAGRIDAASADLINGQWRLKDAWVSGPEGRPQHHDLSDIPPSSRHTIRRASLADTIAFWNLPRFIATARALAFRRCAIGLLVLALSMPLFVRPCD